MSIPNKEQLLSDIAQFLEDEKEIYGSFAFTPDEEEKILSRFESEADETTDQSISEEEPETSRVITLKEKLEACQDLDQLRLLCEEADELRTDLEGTNLVFGVGNPRADLMLIGEAPGEQEEKEGEPFVGAAGQLLNKILAAIDFKREEVYIANILKHRPPGNRNPSPEERLRSLPYLLRQIDLIQPKLILCLGKVSGTTLLDREDTLKNLRGEFYPFRNTLLTVTYHPAALLRNPQWKRPVWEDVQKVKKKVTELSEGK
jgi:DNA polymerase